MEKKKVSFSSKLIIAGIAVIALTPYLPDILYSVINSDSSIYDYHYSDIRLGIIAPSFWLSGIMLCVWGFVLKRKDKDQ